MPTTHFTFAEAGAQIGRNNAPWHDRDPASTTTITFGFLRSNGAGEIRGYTAEMKAQAEIILGMWQDVANIRFERFSDGPDGNIGWNNFGANVWFEANNFVGSGDVGGLNIGLDGPNGQRSSLVIVANGNGAFNDLSPGTYNNYTISHEFGHALGLAHPGNYNAGQGAQISYAADALYIEDSRQYTQMSYFGEDNTGGNFRDLSSMMPLLHDIAAIQFLYGVNLTTRTGNDTYGFNATVTDRPVLSITGQSDKIVGVIYDRGGRDTLDFSGYANSQVIDLNPEAFSSVGGLTFNLSIAPGSVIENAIGGSGADTLIGNGVGNTLTGGSGNNVFDGNGGADEMIGGTNSDRFRLSTGDVVAGERIRGEGGRDYLHISGVVDAQPAQISGIEVIVFDGAGMAGTANLLIIGATQMNTSGILPNGLVRGSLADGTTGGAIETDTLIVRLNGATGVDLGMLDFLTWDTRDAVIVVGNDANGGADRIVGSIVDDEVLAGAGQDAVSGQSGNDVLRGGSGNDSLAGETGNDMLYGEAGADTLEGGAGADMLDGGAGIDILKGGAGNDIYVIDSTSEKADESATAISGSDTVRTSVSFDLSSDRQTAGSVEDLELTGSAAINGTGNRLSNTITGNSAVNVIRGEAGADVLAGGRANDTLTGGTGADRFVFDTALAANVDTIVDFVAGTDVIALDDAVMAGIGFVGGVLQVSAFAANVDGLARDVSDRIVYDTDSGRLFYDANGSLAGGRVQFAMLAASPALSHTDFLVV
ncbi:M10 family metallopeptidase C-terminal domain-containing protein [Ensifer soli]|uniref:M10 family metallopeptidase C-terminal domain-containing protein n=1 Tax=Ciceribacter sp. sgz301302 TaxID=3342379 RepID=UPI0035BA2E2C